MVLVIESILLCPKCCSIVVSSTLFGVTLNNVLCDTFKVLLCSLIIEFVALIITKWEEIKKYYVKIRIWEIIGIIM